MSDDLIRRQAAIDCLIDALYDLDEVDYADNDFIKEELKRVPSVETKAKTPCDLCRFNPPSSGDGKPCSMCPALPNVGRMGSEVE